MRTMTFFYRISRPGHCPTDTHSPVFTTLLVADTALFSSCHIAENKTRTLVLVSTGMDVFIEVILREMYKWSSSW